MADLALPSTTIDVGHGRRWRLRSCYRRLRVRGGRVLSSTSAAARVSRHVFWSSYADEVVGVEPNDAMRAFAETATESHNIRYIGASAYETGLADPCADLVTAAQSLQWM
jgi:hypothetical protein